MTTRTILTDLAAHLATELTGYDIKYFRWTDADESSQTPFVMMRFPGSGGGSDVLLQRIDVLMALVQVPTGAVTGHDDVSAIARRLRLGLGQGSVVRFELLGEPSGPSYLENGRPVWTINVRCYVEGY